MSRPRGRVGRDPRTSKRSAILEPSVAVRTSHFWPYRAIRDAACCKKGNFRRRRGKAGKPEAKKRCSVAQISFSRHQHPDIAVTHRNRPVSVGELRNVIADLAREGAPSIAWAAARLGLSQRSLQRHLERRGLTYSDVVDGTRYEIAASLLCDTRLDIARVGAMLGYRDPSSFSRAFMRWAGCAPRTFRTRERPDNHGSDQVARKGQIARPAPPTVEPSSCCQSGQRRRTPQRRRP